jgi:hypothetical protein
MQLGNQGRNSRSECNGLGMSTVLVADDEQMLQVQFKYNLHDQF